MAARSKSSKRGKAYHDHRGKKLKIITEDDRFSFECDQCARCCHGPTIPLSPYDILKISDYYGITQREFVEEYTLWAPASQSGIPIVLLKTQPCCPFNRDGLCNIYQVRPFFCRSYPVIRIMTYNPSTDSTAVKYSLEKNCSSIKTKRTQTVREWLEEQCGDTYLRESLRWGEFKVRLAGSEYPKDDRVFHRMFYAIVYGLESCEDEMKAMGIPEASSPEEKSEARIKFASTLDWSRAAEEARADGTLFYMKHGEDLALRRNQTR